MCSMSRPDRTLRLGRLSGRYFFCSYSKCLFLTWMSFLFLHLLDDFAEFDRGRAVVVFDVGRAHQVFLKLFVVVEVDEVEQFVEYGLADVGFATDFVEYI